MNLKFFLLASFALFACAGAPRVAIGIDLGTDFVRSVVYNGDAKRAFEVVENTHGKQKMSTAVGYRAGERIQGADALAHARRHPEEVTSGLRHSSVRALCGGATNPVRHDARCCAGCWWCSPGHVFLSAFSSHFPFCRFSKFQITMSPKRLLGKALDSDAARIYKKLYPGAQVSAAGAARLCVRVFFFNCQVSSVDSRFRQFERSCGATTFVLCARVSALNLLQPRLRRPLPAPKS